MYWSDYIDMFFLLGDVDSLLSSGHSIRLLHFQYSSYITAPNIFHDR